MSKTLSIEYAYQGKKFDVIKKIVLLPNGRKAVREIVNYPGASAILPLLSNDKILLLRQYRASINDWIIEIPAGTLKPGEDPLECAKRELEEETGYKAKEWYKLLEIYASPGYSNEVIHIYLAKELIKSRKHPEETEVLENVYLSLEEALDFIRTNKIKDAKTITAILYFELIYETCLNKVNF